MAGGAPLGLEGRAVLGAVARLPHTPHAGREGRLFCAVVPLEVEADLADLAFSAKREGEDLFLLQVVDRGLVVAGVGSALRIDGGGLERFRSCARRWEAAAAEAVVAQPPEGVEVAVPVAMGGFAFAPQGGKSVAWEGFGSGSLTVPEIAFLHLRGERPVLVLSAWVEPGERPSEAVGAVARRVARLERKGLGLLDPLPTAHPRVESALAPEHYEAAVQRATELIGAGKAKKLVIAREVLVHSPQPFAAPALFGALREGFPSCFCFCICKGEKAFIGATPELLVRREGQRLTTVALAGSTRRSADPAVDAHLGEQLLRSASHREEHGIVVERIVAALKDLALWVTAPGEPTLVKVANVQHLATPIRAQLPGPLNVIELAGHLHPTPAVGGEPKEAAYALIPQLEGFDRGWYAGTVGFATASGEGEFCVALRCALLSGGEGRCFAGNGIVRGSDPAAELAETEIKLGAILPLLVG